MEDIHAPAPHFGAPAGLRLKVTGGARPPVDLEMDVRPDELTRWLAGEACLPDTVLQEFAETLFSSITGEAPR
jgi:hypothetical protein